VSELIQAPAKLTTYLHMKGLRGDGFHLLEAEMVSVDLFDRLTFAEGSGLAISGIGAEHLSNGPDNLVSRALGLVGRQAAVGLEKAIPAGGGLGGGSADAAAVFRWAGVDDTALAASLGSDVPFCLRNGRALVSGVGEIVERLNFEPRNYTLLMPPISVDTRAVYKAFDLGAGDRSHWCERNHLQQAAIAVEPRLLAWKRYLEESTGAEAVMAGSGSTWFVEGAHAQPADVESQGARWVAVATTPGS
jgi:4-diphosphocytidyl-2-C-methyl-D-erythritol kinase